MQNRIALAVALTAGMLSTAAIAQTAEEQQLCMNDAFKVCSHTIPDRNRTIACMVQNKSQLSSGCQMVMDKYAPGGQVNTAAMSPARPAMTAAPDRMSTPAPDRIRTATAQRPGKPLNILIR
jgi:glutaminase